MDRANAALSFKNTSLCKTDLADAVLSGANLTDADLFGSTCEDGESVGSERLQARFIVPEEQEPVWIDS